MFIASKFLYPAPSGAECKPNLRSTWRSAGARSYWRFKAINMVLLRSTPGVTDLARPLFKQSSSYFTIVSAPTLKSIAVPINVIIAPLPFEI